MFVGIDLSIFLKESPCATDEAKDRCIATETFASGGILNRHITEMTFKREMTLVEIRNGFFTFAKI